MRSHTRRQETEATKDMPRHLHGTLRGLERVPGSPQFEGRFGRLFRTLPPARFDEEDLKSLATAMNAEAEARPTSEDENDDEENTGTPDDPGISAGVTYLGQFIDHDLTFDPASSLQQQDDPDGLIDFRTPRFDLDNLYGKGPDDAPYLYHSNGQFILGRPLTGASSNPNARDLPRSAPTAGPAEDINDARRAIIGDPRNDENVIVSQLQGLMLRFHNKLMSEDTGPARNKFQRVQAEVRFHYQWMLVNDFLPTIVWEDVLRDVIPHHYKNSDVRAFPPKLIYFDLAHEPVMPLEFSGAA